MSRQIAPVVVFSTGRCGSTMISSLLSMHPEVLSLSEAFLGTAPDALQSSWMSGDEFADHPRISSAPQSGSGAL
jgi:hypothetical protein